MSENRNAEIWSTRLQKELLALTTTDDTKDKDVAGGLPPFVSLKNHELDIAAGSCKVSFLISLATTETTEPQECVVALDVSLPTQKDGTLDVSTPAYPFEKPTAILSSGATIFPEGSTIQNGDLLDIDCDWTPSLHLTDAILNVGLKIKESVLQAEPFHPVQDNLEDTVEKSMDEVINGAKRFGTFLSKSAKGLTVSTTSGMEEFKTKRAAKKKITKKKKQKSIASADQINIGDEINLLEAPWVDARGVYSCKAVRKPHFIQDAIDIATAVTEQKEEKQPSGFSGAGSMFRSFAQSAKSVLEESFLMITDTHLIELKSSKMNLGSGTVTFAITIDMLAKLKFRREESISLFFKPALDDPLIFMCPDSANAVHQIQNVLKRHGVKGKHTNVATQRAISEAMQLVEVIKGKEKTLENVPTVERVNEIMDLYRQAAERFEVAGDVRHEECVVHMRKFLALPFTSSILDGSHVQEDKPESQAKTSANPAPTLVDMPPVPVPEGEVLERTLDQLEDDESATGPCNQSEKNEDQAFSENMDSILKEAKDDLQNFASGDDLDGLLSEENTDGLTDDYADLDAMFSAADKELADLMIS